MCGTKEGRILLLRLCGMGFYPEDATTLVRLWESGRSKEELLEVAVDLGYEPGANLDSALDVEVRPRSTDDDG